MNKKKVGIIFGGQSTEYEISLQSVKNIVNFIDYYQFDIVLIGINKKGTWNIYENIEQIPFEGDLNNRINNNKQLALLLNQCKEHRLVEISDFITPIKIDVIFPIIHGSYGEDGSLQGLLQMANIAYVGSNVLSSAISINKDIAKKLLRDSGISVAPFIVVSNINRSNIKFNEIIKTLGLPLFIKPVNHGSSIGVSKINNEKEFNEALKLAFKFSSKILIETAIVGRELECAVLGNDSPKVSLCGEVVSKYDFHSYYSKYIDTSNIKKIQLAKLDKSISDKIRKIALKVFNILSCEGMARIDFFLTENGTIIVNEVNTIPGFTSVSTYIELWKSSDLNPTNLITQLIKLAIEKQNNLVKIQDYPEIN